MQVKRSGFVFSLYKMNMRNLWILAGVLLLILASMLYKSHSYLANYLFYRSEPDAASLTAFVEGSVMDIEEAYADILAHGGDEALIRQRTQMFLKDTVYQEGDRYRFGIPIDPEKLINTGIYYDETCKQYMGYDKKEQVKQDIPREHYLKEHLYFYEYDGLNFLLVMDTDREDELRETERVVFAPMSIYSVYMVRDLYCAGYFGPLYNYFIDLRDTPVDFEDDDFKDLVLVFPFVLLALIPAILFSLFPALHPTYRQLDKFARSIQKAVDQVDANYEEFGIVSEDRKTWYLEDWLVKRSWLKNGIEKNWKKQTY